LAELSGGGARTRIPEGEYLGFDVRNVAEKFRELALLESRVALVGWMLGLLMNKKKIQ